MYGANQLRMRTNPEQELFFRRPLPPLLWALNPPLMANFFKARGQLAKQITDFTLIDSYKSTNTVLKVLTTTSTTSTKKQKQHVSTLNVKKFEGQTLGQAFVFSLQPRLEISRFFSFLGRWFSEKNCQACEKFCVRQRGLFFINE
jgi:hypothetical protein